MECRLQGICKFCQPEKSELALSIEEVIRTQGRRLKPGESFISPELSAQLPKKHYTRKTLVGGGSIKEKLAGRVWHCKKCAFTAPNAGLMASHCRLTHPKGKPSRKPGKQAPADLKPASDKKDEHAFKALQKRANKGKLTEEQTTVFDNIEPSIIGKRANDWPDGAKESVINLYKDVTGKREDN